MSWIILLVGLALWVGAHLFKRVAPEMRAALGEKRGMGIVAVVLVLSLVLMVIGYRAAPVVQLWYPPVVLTHINNAIMLFAVFLLFVGKTGGRIAGRIRHPQLTAVKIWALAHLLVNGDLASVILFGGMLGWAVSEVVVINRSEGTWTPPETTRNGDVKAAVAGAVFYVLAVGVHVWTGHFAMG